ncbi:MAG TPA: transcription termination/antitermination NusG family protein, partial [Nocardioides sp.]|nr:transcription termination/antitermination NusG family protein [Nocardioides sp.]
MMEQHVSEQYDSAPEIDEAADQVEAAEAPGEDADEATPAADEAEQAVEVDEIDDTLEVDEADEADDALEVEDADETPVADTDDEAGDESEEPVEVAEAADEDPLERFRRELWAKPGDWFVVHTYSGMENRVKQNLENRIHSLNMEDYIHEIVVPTEEVAEIKNGQRKMVKRTVL